jgi:hypothetical protein
MSTKTADLAAQVTEQRERLTGTVGTLADKIGELDTGDLRARAGSGAADLLENATDSAGKPKRGLVLGAVAVLVGVVLLRKLMR